MSIEEMSPDVDVLEEIVDAIHQRHGYDVMAFDMSEFPLTMDIFLFASADNRIQSRAMADRSYLKRSWLWAEYHGMEQDLFSRIRSGLGKD